MGGATSETRVRKILVIDDDPLVGLLFRRSLARVNQVCLEESAIDALRRLERGETFDLILCDVHMPGMTGADFYHWVCRCVPEHASRIVLMSATPANANRDMLEDVPVPCMTKPLSPKSLDRIARILTR